MCYLISYLFYLFVILGLMRAKIGKIKIRSEKNEFFHQLVRKRAGKLVVFTTGFNPKPNFPYFCSFFF